MHQIKSWWNHLQTEALKYSYYPKQSEFHITVKHKHDQHVKNGLSRTNNNIAVIGAKHVGVVIRSLTFKEGYTTDEKLNSGTDNKRFYYKLLN